jgi:hypothetical protein
VGAFLVRFDANPAWFVHFGREGSVLPVARRALGADLLVPHTDGHDGQAFWLLARDPLLVSAKDARRYLDRPAYRAQRVLYPALAAPWRFAGERALLWGLLATNLVTVAAGGYAAALLARDLGVPARAGLAFALNPAVLAGVLLDTSDTLMLALLVMALLYLVRRRWLPAGIAAAAACLAKEQALLAVAAVTVLGQGLPRRVRVALAAAAFGAVGAWALYERWRLGWPPSQVQEFTWPVWGYVDAYLRGWRHFNNWADTVVAAALWPLAWVTVRRWRRTRSLAASSALPYALYVPFLSAQVVDLTVNALRAVGPLLTLVAIDLYARTDDRSACRATAPGPQLRHLA